MNTTCAERVDEHMESRLNALRQLWELYCKDCEAYDEEYGNLDEYGLSFDYVAPETFSDQPEGYFRYQISCGGPGEEFRFYADQKTDWDFSVYRVEFWFLDWFDGAPRALHGADLELMTEIFQSYFVDSGTAIHLYNEAYHESSR